MPTLDLTDAEFQALAGLLNAATQALGIRALKDGAAILVKMEAAESVSKTSEKATAKAPRRRVKAKTDV